jgi:hypothetical protein
MSNLLRSFEFEDYIKQGTCAFFTLRTSEVQNKMKYLQLKGGEIQRHQFAITPDNAFEYDLSFLGTC